MRSAGSGSLQCKLLIQQKSFSFALGIKTWLKTKKNRCSFNKETQTLNIIA